MPISPTLEMNQPERSNPEGGEGESMKEDPEKDEEEKEKEGLSQDSETGGEEGRKAVGRGRGRRCRPTWSKKNMRKRTALTEAGADTVSKQGREARRIEQERRKGKAVRKVWGRQRCPE